jgi:hypothetical protein
MDHGAGVFGLIPLELQRNGDLAFVAIVPSHAEHVLDDKLGTQGQVDHAELHPQNALSEHRIDVRGDPADDAQFTQRRVAAELPKL